MRITVLLMLLAMLFVAAPLQAGQEDIEELARQLGDVSYKVREKASLALLEIGLPQNNVPLALLFFNVGIEIGQIVFIILAIAVWWLIKRMLILTQVTINQERLLPFPVYILGGLSAMWCIERGLELI